MRHDVAMEISHLSKSFGALQVTKNVGITVKHGEACGIIGPNGAGKTTLFNLVTGTMRPDAGEICFFGTDCTKATARARCQLGMARSFQVPQPFGGLTTYENVLVAASFGRGVSQADAAPMAVHALEQTGLAKLADRKASALTLLDRKRLELARAIATDPKLLLLDEIAGGLTESECQSLIALIKSIKDSGVTIIWIEHVLHALLSVVDRVLVLDFGEIIAEGPPDTILQNPDVAAIYLGVDPEAGHG